MWMNALTLWGDMLIGDQSSNQASAVFPSWSIICPLSSLSSASLLLSINKTAKMSKKSSL